VAGEHVRDGGRVLTDVLPDDDMLPDDTFSPSHERGARLLKRAMDIAGSALALVVLAPLGAAIAILIALTSRGPMLFRQERVGLRGRPFVMLKFRSMYVEADAAVHQAYVARLIAGDVNGGGISGAAPYKLSQDARITPLGRFLRRTSLDELPQFFNVLKGEMSLVGPRPPIPYEVERYAEWHRDRLKVKPGITGLWQVGGRSRTTFDDMVRLDLRYARSWSVWLDVKILFQTLRAIISGRGAL
jgi:exopolysaccharide biosynthesis polyprenyl glycosylphosphotransferase